MSDLEVAASELTAVSGELGSLAQSLHSGLGSLDGEISGLLGGGWSGEAASAYTGVWQEWHEGASRVVEGLTRMSALLQEAGESYSGTDTAAGAEVSEAGL